jgi:uncharacterized membrane protein
MSFGVIATDHSYIVWLNVVASHQPMNANGSRRSRPFIRVAVTGLLVVASTLIGGFASSVVLLKTWQIAMFFLAGLVAAAAAGHLTSKKILKMVIPEPNRRRP